MSTQQAPYTAISGDKPEEKPNDNKVLKWVLVGFACVCCLIIFFCCIVPLFAAGAAIAVSADELSKINWSELNSSTEATVPDATAETTAEATAETTTLTFFGN